MLGQWITCDNNVETPVFQKTFTLEPFTRADIEISGLGYYTLLVNGRRATSDLFTPAQTNYFPRDTTAFTYPIRDEMACRVLYLRYDISSLLRVGESMTRT